MGEGEHYHLVPLHDAMPHDVDTLDCVCGPDVEWGEGGRVGVSHHSLDGREKREHLPWFLRAFWRRWVLLLDDSDREVHDDLEEG